MKASRYTILFLAATLAGVVGVYVLIRTQAAQQRQAIEARIAEREKSADAMRQATAGIDRVQGKFAELSDAASAVESRLVTEHKLDRAVKDIWKLADANSLQTRMIQPLAIRPAGDCSEQPVEMDVTGDFDAFYTFVQQLERLPRLMRIAHLDLHRLPDSSGGVSARLTVGIFFKSDTGQINESIETSATAAVSPP